MKKSYSLFRNEMSFIIIQMIPNIYGCRGDHYQTYMEADVGKNGFEIWNEWREEGQGTWGLGVCVGSTTFLTAFWSQNSQNILFNIMKYNAMDILECIHLRSLPCSRPKLHLFSKFSCFLFHVSCFFLFWDRSRIELWLIIEADGPGDSDVRQRIT